MHTSGPKRDFNWRLETPERAYAAGFRRLGIGALFGLGDWRREALVRGGARPIFVAPLLEGAIDHFPAAPAPLRGRIPAADPYRGPRFGPIGLRLPPASARRRPGALHARISPAARRPDSPGHYPDQRREPHRAGRLHRRGPRETHRTERGRIVALAADASEWAAAPGATNATGQFEIADDRPPGEVASRVRQLGYEPVWKDWDTALTA